ncbi:thymidylate kinase [Aliiruegeria haliotis]|uniref:Thymidylate kinase n=1 Tax=Aliiruegeria haliotis TaxID=1280846 RepID=A0A2T0RVJ6_9RHOB|nr:hypothetical protein [Aliiruegeria haliotis]PRY25201.1 thymidylate kinase [Aliiruegeria haliotis]
MTDADSAAFVPTAGSVLELIGPPASGKTTLALAVAAELRQRGTPVNLQVSARPGEVPGDTLEPGAALNDSAPRPRSRAAKLGDILRDALGTTARDPLAAALLELMPLSGSLNALRRRRYLASLAAGQGTGLTLRDQGYLCAVAGLALDSGRTDEAILNKALRLIPLPDVTVWIDVAPDVTAARLRDRLSQQGRAARLLERTPDANPALARVFDTIMSLLERDGKCVVRVCGEAWTDFEAAVPVIVSAALDRGPKASVKVGPK